jgi:hypothetical protein
MLNADCLKEEIGWLKLVVTLFSALLAPLATWVVQNYDVATPERVWLGIFLSGVFFLIISHAAAEIYHCIRRLGEL